VARAVVGTGRALASASFVSTEAEAVSCGAVTDSFARALSVLMELVRSIRAVHPSNVIRADAVRTVARIVRETHAPIALNKKVNNKQRYIASKR
jgi:hypothetical protein